jgi:predicted transcriptional regulator
MNEWDQEKFEREILDEVERVSAKPKVVVRKAANGDVRAQRVSPSSPPGYGILSGAAKAAASPQQLSGEDLKTMRFDPIKYVVPGIIVEGLTLFAGKPKIGKSWLLLHAAIAVARGGFTLGDVHCAEGDVLYCALEDNARRLQSRLIKLLGLQEEWPARLKFWCEMPRLINGGLEQIKQWIATANHPRLIIVDTLALIRAPNRRDQSTYDADYSAVKDLRDLAYQHGVALVLVHHLRKADADDAFDTVSGTLGLTGAPDTILVLKRDTAGNIILHGRGRDLVEIEKAVTFNRDACTWTIAGDASLVRTTRERATILGAISDATEPIGPNEIAAAAGMKPTNVRQLLRKLVKDGAVSKADYGRYTVTATATPITRSHSRSHSEQALEGTQEPKV